MNISETWVLENIIDEKYIEQLKRYYANQNLEKILLLNIDLRLLYLKHIFMIENSLKKMLLNQIVNHEIQSMDKTYYLNIDNLKNLKLTRRCIRSGYHKYSRNGFLKSKNIHNLIEVMSFESIMNLLKTLNNESLKKVAVYFGINEYDSQNILIEQLDFLKDVRNYLSHNFKVLMIHFSKKNSGSYYQNQLGANNDHHYLHIIIDHYSSKSQVLKKFSQEYQELFQNYQITISTSDIEMEHKYE